HSLKDVNPELVILYGGHLPSGKTPLITVADEWETPLGNIQIEKEVAVEIKNKYGLFEDNYPDNTIEIQLPLVKYYFPSAKILALRLPCSLEAAELSENLIKVVQKTYKNIVILASTDLTHYGDNYDFAPAGQGKRGLDWVKKNDKCFIDLSLKLKTKDLLEYAEKKQSACSSGAVAGLTVAVKMLGAVKGELLGYKTSYDVVPASSFVGYAGIIY
ncbi:MAG: AmmeMemoRadiSam system protein B, partial [Candidatus Firestonebacteria bacterium RIFOXYA2_FULL_40_8]